MRQSLLRILIVDDESESRRRIRTMLEETFAATAVQIGEAATCLQARAALEEARYDAMLLDYRLCHEGRMELLHVARSLQEGSAILLMSERGDPEAAVQVMKFGAADYLVKDRITPELLRVSLSYAVDVREQENRRRQAEAGLQQANRELQRSVRELQCRARDSQLLNELGAQLQVCLTVEEAYHCVSQLGPRLFPRHAGAAYLLNPAGNLFESVTEWGAQPLGARSFSSEQCRAVLRGRTHHCRHPETDLVCQHLATGFAGPTLCVPLAAQGELLGVFTLRQERWQEPAQAAATGSDVDAESGADAESDADALQRLAETLAKHVALAFANLKLRQILQAQSVRDPLTGLFNRRYMEESLDREVCSAVRRRRPLAVMMIDLDHFKTFNDSFGHAVGDRVLCELGSFLLRRTRGEDVACRYGGEEFVLILPEASLADAWKRAEQLREEFKTLHYLDGVESAATVTLSIGLASFPEHGLNARALLQHADRGLYLSKTAGRDRVAVAPEEPAGQESVKHAAARPGTS
jgi:diguanylate cyclase (GGDEF)-like protein